MNVYCIANHVPTHARATSTLPHTNTDTLENGINVTRNHLAGAQFGEKIR